MSPGLPITPADTDEPLRHRPPHGAGRAVTVLVAEADPELSAQLSALIEVQGFTARTCAPADVAGHVAGVDVVVLPAATAPERTAERLRTLRALAPTVRWVVVEDDERLEPTRVGAVAVVRRPFSPRAVVDAVALAADAEEGFSGRLHGLSLIDLLQAYSLAGASLTLVVRGETDGRIVLRAGDVVDAECEGLVGEAALVPILRMRRGVVETRPPEPRARTIHLPFDHVLLEALRVLDEGRRRTVHPPTRHASGEFSFAGLLDDERRRSSVPPAADRSTNGWPTPLAGFLAAHGPGASAWWCDGDGRVRRELADPARCGPPSPGLVTLAAVADPGFLRVEVRRGGTAWAAVRHGDGFVVLARAIAGEELWRRFRYEVTQLVRWLAEEARR